jgi:1,4-dihydroxy-2-naphthoyl-CoA synthase
MEPLLQFLGELIFQVGGELLAELGLRSMRESFRHTPNPVIAAFGYAIAGGLSLLVLPSLLLASHTGRVVNLVLTPLAAGFVMSRLGAWRRTKDQEVVRITHFTYGYLFALGMALVRFFVAH